MLRLGVWELDIPGKGDQPAMRFTTIDGRDWTVPDAHRRNVVMTLSMPTAGFETVVVKGYHVHEPAP